MLENNQLMVIDNKKRNRHISIIIGVTMLLSIIMSIIPIVSNTYATNITENKKTNTTASTTNETTTSKEDKENNTIQDTTKNTNNTKSNASTNKTKKTDNTSKSSKSNNANLKELGVKPNDFKGFNPSRTSYNITVENNVENIEIYAVAQHAKASIAGNGKKSLKEGKNAFNVIVTAEDNTKKTYTITVNRKSENSEESDEEKNNNDAILSELEVKNIDLNPEFSPDIYEYNITLTDEVDKLDIIAVSEKNDATIEILGNENLAIGENVITILVKENDKEVSTYQLIVNKKQPLASNQEEISEVLEQNTAWSNKKKIIIIALIAVICIAGITALIIRYKHTDGKKEDVKEADGNKKEKTKGKKKPKRMN